MTIHPGEQPEISDTWRTDDLTGKVAINGNPMDDYTLVRAGKTQDGVFRFASGEFTDVVPVQRDHVLTVDGRPPHVDDNQTLFLVKADPNFRPSSNDGLVVFRPDGTVQQTPPAPPLAPRSRS